MILRVVLDRLWNGSAGVYIITEVGQCPSGEGEKERDTEMHGGTGVMDCPGEVGIGEGLGRVGKDTKDLGRANRLYRPGGLHLSRCVRTYENKQGNGGRMFNPLPE